MAKFVSVAKAAQLLGVSRASMQQLIRSGELTTFEGKVEIEQLRENFPALAFNESPVVERARIIRDTAYGERLQKLTIPSTEALEAKIKRISVDLNVERAKARDYLAIIHGLLEKLSDMQQHGDENQRQTIHELNIWLLTKFNSSNEP